MKIKSINIKNFKNFIGNHKFNLKDINILYAENGFGKSSFFDAIEWCITGGISRFKDFDENDIINYNVKDEQFECEVSILFENGTLTRNFKVKELKKHGNKSVYVEYKNNIGTINRESGDKNISKLIHNNLSKESSYINKINQNHILSQDQVTDFINKENPKVRYKSLLSILGIQNSTITTENFKKINKQLELKLENINDVIKCNKEKIDTINKYKEEISKDLIEKIHIIDNTIGEISYEEILDKYKKEEILDCIKKDINKNNIHKQIFIKIKELGLEGIESLQNNYKENKNLIEKNIYYRDEVIKRNNNIEDKLQKIKSIKGEKSNIDKVKLLLKKYTIESKLYNINTTLQENLAHQIFYVFELT